MPDRPIPLLLLAQIRKSWLRRRAPISLLVYLLVTACTYGPEEERATISQIVRVGDSYRALIVIQYERFQQATGLTAFPDGGKARVLERRARVYLIDASQFSASMLTEQAAPDSLWESFSMSVRGLVEDTVSYLYLTGCPRRGECHPELRNSANLRLSMDGNVEVVAEIPGDARLPGVMLARREGEQHYVRFSTSGNTVTARFEEDATFEARWEVASDGSLLPIG